MEDPALNAPLSLPVRLSGRWKRDWRVGGSLVGQGWLELEAEGLRLHGARTGWARGAVVVAVRLLAFMGFLAACGAGLLTAIGLTWRTKTPDWLWMAVAVIPVALIGAKALTWLSRRVLERPRTWVVPWTDVRRIGVPPGPTIELAFVVQGRELRGRFRAGRFDAASRTLLVELRRGQAPAAAPGLSIQPLPSRRRDQALLLLLAGTAAGGGAAAWPRFAPLVQGPPTHGPAAGVPARAAAQEIDARVRACPRGPVDAPAVHNRREGQDLSWTREGGAGFATVHLAVDKRGTSALLAQDTGEAGRVADAFAEAPPLVISVVVPAAEAAAVAARAGDGDLEGALCSGAVGRLDLARGAGGEPEGFALVRDGDDLRITAPAGRYRVLAARQRDTSRLDWFDRCELALHEGRVVLPRVDGSLRLPDFFEGGRDEARVLLVEADGARPVRQALDRVLQGGEAALPCLQLDLLEARGLALGRASTARAGSALAQAAADLTRARPLPQGDAEALIGALDARQGAVLAALDPRGRAQRQAVEQGFLDGVAWGIVLDTLSMKDDLAQVERIRQRLSGPGSHLGELFLLRLAEELLERIPPEDTGAQYDARVDVALAWLDVTAGRSWTQGGREVTVPDEEVAAYYNVVGHYLLVDVGRRVEARMNRDLAFRVTGLPLRWRLAQHGVEIDIEKSDAQKALEAWVTGDFEYLGDRALARLAEQASDQKAVLEAAASADYRLRGQWAAGDGAARTATLLRGGEELGWVALYDQEAVALGMHPIGGGGTSREALGAGHAVLLATAGSYVTNAGKTAGLSALDGHVDNFLISNKMDGLVLVDAQGRLSMLDMRHGGALPGQDTAIRPLERLADLHVLLRWIEDHGASAFQTHLLGYGGALTIDPGKASGTLRERRLLVQAAYRGHPLVAIVDLPGTPKTSLYEAAIIAVQALRAPEAEGGPGLDVLAIANLDVGSYNALEAWTDEGRQLRESWKPIGEAMNLVSVRRR